MSGMHQPTNQYVEVMKESENKKGSEGKFMVAAEPNNEISNWSN
jgi:hypothetical protein